MLTYLASASCWAWAPIFALAIPASVKLDNVVSANAVEFCVAAVPNPKFVLATAASAMSAKFAPVPSTLANLPSVSTLS